MLTYIKCKEFKNIDSPTGRVYEVPPGVYPSVTTVLSATKDTAWLQAWKDKVGEQTAADILQAASERGTKVHGYIEQLYTNYSCPTLSDALNYFNQLPLKTDPPHIQRMVLNLSKILISNKYESIAQEFVVWDTDLKIAGRCDNLGYWNGQLTLVDFKTSTKEKHKSHIKDYFLQASAYCKAHNSLFANKIKHFIIILVNEQGTSQIFTGNPLHYIPELRYRVNKYYSKERNE